MTADDVKRLEELLRYLDRWKRAQNRYYKWIYTEWARRKAAYTAVGRRGRNALLSALHRNLKFDRGGRVLASLAVKRKFRGQTDRILAAVVETGEEVFGIRGERNRAGIYIGTLDEPTKKLALAELKTAFKKAESA